MVLQVIRRTCIKIVPTGLKLKLLVLAKPENVD
jgi:hypothetical protein